VRNASGALTAAVAIIGAFAGGVERFQDIPEGSSIHDFSDLA